MSVDTIGNFLTAIRNALLVRKRTVTVPFSKMNVGIVEVLKEEGYINDFKKLADDPVKPLLKLFLRYSNNESVVHEIKRISSPGKRVYEGVRKMTSVTGGLGTSILSTNVGIITDREARRRSVGGEVVCHIW